MEAYLVGGSWKRVLLLTGGGGLFGVEACFSLGEGDRGVGTCLVFFWGGL